MSTDTPRRRIHILTVVDDLGFGGDEFRLLAFSQSVDKSRFQHTIVSVMKADLETGERHGFMKEQFRRAGVRLLDLGHLPRGDESGGWTAKLSSFKEKVRKLQALVREENIDVLDVHLAPPNPAGAAASLATGIPFTVTLYQLPVKPSAKVWIATQFNLGRAALLITDSDAQASRIRRGLLCSPEIRVIANGPPPPLPALPRQELLRFFDIPDDPTTTIIGQVSTLISYKGHLVLLEAAKRVLERHPKCLFLLVGYEPANAGYRESLRQRAFDLGISERVRIAGYPGNIGDVWNIIDIHAHASLLDSLPNALLEAMSLGKPSVITSVGGIPEAIESGENGLLVPPGDPDQLARHLLLLLENSGLRTKLGLAAQATYARRFRPEIMARQLEDCFSVLAKQ